QDDDRREPAIQRGVDIRRQLGGDLVAGQRRRDVALLLKVDVEIAKVDGVEQEKACQFLAQRIPDGSFAPVVQLPQDAHQVSPNILVVMRYRCVEYTVDPASSIG